MLIQATRKASRGTSRARLALVLLAAVLLALPVSTQGQTQLSPGANDREQEPYRVLFLNLEVSSWPWAVSMFSTCRREFEEATGRHVEMLIEKPWIDQARSPGEPIVFDPSFWDRYGDRMDFVVAWGPFHGASETFAGSATPVILPSQYIWQAQEPESASANVYTARIRFSMAKTAQVMLENLPGIRKIVIISGIGRFGRFVEARAREEMGDSYRGAAIEYWSGAPLPELIRRVAGLPSDHAVLYLVVSKDRTGAIHIPREVVKQLSRVSSVPIFGVANTYLGHGAVGGYVDSSEIVGRRAAGMLARLTRGEPLAAVSEVEDYGEYQFDWRQMTRWGISERQLPAEARVLNRPGSFLERHPGLLRALGAVGVVLILTLLTLVWHLRLRRRAEAALERSELLYRSIVEDLPVLVCRNTPEGVIEFVNQAYCEYFGLAREELIGKDFITLIPESDRERVRANLSGLSKENPLCIHDHRAVDANGIIRHHRWTNRAIVNERGEVTVLQALGEDITDKRAAEQALRESEEKFRLLFERSSDAYVIHIDGRIVDCNAACLRMLRMTDRDELIGRHPAEISPPRQEDGADSRVKAKEMIDQAFAAGSHRFEWTMQRTDGEYLLTDVLLNAITLEGKPALHAVWRDITAQKRAEQELRESRRQLATLLSNLPGMAYRCANGPPYTMEFVSEGCYALTGYTAAQLVADTHITYSQVIHPDDRAMVWDTVQKALKDERSFEVVCRIITADGTEKYVWEQGRGVPDENNRVTAIEGYIVDITERREAETKVREHQAKLQALAATLSQAEERERRRLAVQLHDSVGQDLAVTKLSLQSLSASCEPSDVSCEIDRICRDVDRTIDDVRSVTSELSNPVLYEVGLTAALESWLEEHVCDKHGMAYTIEADDGVRRLGLATELRVVLFRTVRELVTNVVKHAQADHVDIRLCRSNGRIQVTVADDGMGFSEEPDSQRTSRTDSFGLFSIRAQLDELHGALEVESEPGHGACVTITVPIG